MSRRRTALATLLVGAAAYVGLFLLLTAEDRRERRALLHDYGEVLLSAPAPAPAPPGGDPVAVSAWKRALDLHRARRSYEDRAAKERYFAIGLFGALVAQTAITAAVMFRSSRAAAAPAPARTRSAPPRRS